MSSAHMTCLFSGNGFREEEKYSPERKNYIRSVCRVQSCLSVAGEELDLPARAVRRSVSERVSLNRQIQRTIEKEVGTRT